MLNKKTTCKIQRVGSLCRRKYTYIQYPGTNPEKRKLKIPKNNSRPNKNIAEKI